MKNKMKKRLNVAVKILSELKGCPNDDGEFIKRPKCAKCSDGQNLEKCWLDYLTWRIKINEKVKLCKL